jgi:hypothetical protein
MNHYQVQRKIGIGTVHTKKDCFLNTCACTHEHAHTFICMQTLAYNAHLHGHAHGRKSNIVSFILDKYLSKYKNCKETKQMVFSLKWLCLGIYITYSLAG